MTPDPVPPAPVRADTQELVATPCIFRPGRFAGDGKSYSRSERNGIKVPTHKMIYEGKFGSVPHGLNVCHRCNNKGCINIDHLYLATQSQNIRDAYRDGVAISGNTKKTKCTRCGGPYEYKKNGKRFCRQCAAIHTAKYRAKRRMATRGEL